MRQGPLVVIFSFFMMAATCLATESSTLRLAREWEAKQARAENLLGGYPLGRAIRDSDPVSFAMLVDTLAKRIDKPNQQRLLQSEMHQLVNGMVRQKLLRAEDGEISWFFDSELAVMKQAQKLDPVECGRTVVSEQDFALNFGPRLPQDFFQKRTEKLAAIIQAAAAKAEKKTDTSKAEKSMQGVMETLYTLHGEQLDRLGEYTTDKLELIEQCRMSVNMFKAISLIPEQRKANVYRVMLQHSIRDPR